MEMGGPPILAEEEKSVGRGGDFMAKPELTV